jgi:hypothetical protein
MNWGGGRRLCSAWTDWDIERRSLRAFLRLLAQFSLIWCFRSTVPLAGTAPTSPPADLTGVDPNSCSIADLPKGVSYGWGTERGRGSDEGKVANSTRHIDRINLDIAARTWL